MGQKVPIYLGLQTNLSPTYEVMKSLGMDSGFDLTSAWERVIREYGGYS